MDGTECAQPKPGFCKYPSLILDIEKGNTQIPRFQRDFVWDKKRSAALIDSILKGYPIGTFILWKTKDRLNNIKRLGNQDLPVVPDDNFVEYVLDGQQRLASLFVIVKGLTVKKGDREEDYKNIYIDLESSLDSENIVSASMPDDKKYITVYDLLNRGIAYLADEYKEYLDKIQLYQNALRGYDFSTITIDGYPIEKAVEVFNRINTTGKALSLFEIIVAKTYDDRSFDLSIKYDALQNKLSKVAYKIPAPQILQCVSVNLRGECTRKVILGLPSKDIINAWDDTVNAIKKTVDHFRKAYRIPSSSLVPYPALVVPFSYFFFKNGDGPTEQQDTYLKEYFWRAALTSRFTSGVESKLALDCKFMKAIMDNDRPSYGKDFNVTLKKEDIRDLQFRASDSINRAILCIMTAACPKSFKNNNSVTLDNSRLHSANSKNYHHFFPKSFLKKQGIASDRINLISNITLVEDYVNKKIGDKPPSKYMQEFKDTNSRLDETMKTHLIDDLDSYGVWENNYDVFINKRSDRIWLELNARFDPYRTGA